MEILDDLSLGEYEVKLNHRRLLDAMLDIAGVPPQVRRMQPCRLFFSFLFSLGSWQAGSPHVALSWCTSTPVGGEGGGGMLPVRSCPAEQPRLWFWGPGRAATRTLVPVAWPTGLAGNLPARPRRLIKSRCTPTPLRPLCVFPPSALAPYFPTPQKFRPICSAIDKLDKEPWEAVREGEACLSQALSHPALAMLWVVCCGCPSAALGTQPWQSAGPVWQAPCAACTLPPCGLGLCPCRCCEESKVVLVSSAPFASA